MEEREPLYGMAVAARLTRMHPQTLRKYERAGLLRPARSSGSQRLYSPADVRRLSRIRYLVEERGLNVAGLEMTLGMVDRLHDLDETATAAEMRTRIDEVIAMSGGDTEPVSPPRRRRSGRAPKRTRGLSE